MTIPAATDYKGTLLVGSYAIDQEGVPGEKVTLVDEGKLKNMLMSRRPGPDSNNRMATDAALPVATHGPR